MLPPKSLSKQSLAIAYNVKRKAQKLAKGGEACRACLMAQGGKCIAHAPAMAEGGDVELAATHLKQDTSDARQSLGLPEHREEMTHAMPAEPETAEPDSLHDIMNKVKISKPSHYAEGGVVDAIMKERYAAPMEDETATADQSDPMDFDHADHDAAPEASPEAADAFDTSSDFSQYHSAPDAAHGNIPATESEKLYGQNDQDEDDDGSLVAQILRERRTRRRE